MERIYYQTDYTDEDVEVKDGDKVNTKKHRDICPAMPSYADVFPNPLTTDLVTDHQPGV